MTSDFPYRTVIGHTPRIQPRGRLPRTLTQPQLTFLEQPRSQAPLACLWRELREELGVEMASARTA